VSFAILTRMHPQVFSTSRCFSPPITFRIYFAPVTLLGFNPSEVFPRCAPNTSRLVVPLLTLSSWEASFPRRSLQGFERTTSPCSHLDAGEGFRAADPLVGFVLSRVFIPPATTNAFHLASPHAIYTSPAREHAMSVASGFQSQAARLAFFKSCRPS